MSAAPLSHLFFLSFFIAFGQSCYSGQCSPGVETACVDTHIIYVGQTTNAGTVTVSSNGTGILFVIRATGGWTLTGVNIYLGYSIDYTGYSPDRFPYKKSGLRDVTSYTWFIPFNGCSWRCNSNVQVAVSTSMHHPGARGDTCAESGWAYGYYQCNHRLAWYWVWSVCCRQPVVTTAIPTTAVPTTRVPTTRVPTTRVPTTAIPTTRVPTTRVPTTAVPTTAIPTTRVPTTAVPTTAVPTTRAPTTAVPTTAVVVGTTANPTTAVPTTAQPTTAVPTTDVPTTAVPTTAVPTTDVPTTDVPTTDVPTTAVPTTGIPTTAEATTAVATTAVATTGSPAPPPPDNNGECTSINAFFGAVPSLFNLFVFEDFSCSNSDTEGRLAAGGNVTISGYSVGCKVYPPPQGSTCVPYGSVTCDQIAEDGNWVSTVVAGQNIYATGGEIKLGNVATGGSYVGDSTIKYGVGCTAYVGDLIDFAYWRTYLIDLSSKLQGLRVTGTTQAQYGGVILTGTFSHHMEVFSVRGADLCSASYFQINHIDDFSTIIINVDGDNLNCGRMGMSGYNPQNVVFNFYQAHSLTFQSVSWLGSVLAPLADIVNPDGNMLGQVFANSWTSTGSTCMQQNWYPFLGCISDCIWNSTSPLCTYSETAYGQQSCPSAPTGCPAFDALSNEFYLAFPAGIQVGCNVSVLQLSTADTIRGYLPQTSAGLGLLDDIYIDATSTPAGDFAAQVLILGLSLGFDFYDPSFSPACGYLKDIYICNINSPSCGAFNGQTVGDVYVIANQILGQCDTTYSVNATYACVKTINDQFSGCQTWSSSAASTFAFCSCGTNICANTPDYIAAQYYAAQDTTATPQLSSAALIVPTFFAIIYALLM